MGRGEAPGRVNLIGEHTDYNAGLVLPAILPHRITVSVRRRSDELVRVSSAGFGAMSFALRDEDRAGGWSDHIRGVTWALLNDGRRIGGFDAEISSRVPAGAGLASSAALEVALLRALRDEFGLPLDEMAIAMLAHRAESEFVGANVGTMDQLAASFGREGGALFIDTRSNAMEHVALPAELRLIVVDSGIAHRHASGGYNARRHEAEDAARAAGLEALRDATHDDVMRIALASPTLAARARHVVSENERVLRFRAALQLNDLDACGRLLDESHRSLRDDYAVSLPEIDQLVEILRAERGVLGARIVGGGFGGAVLALGTAEARDAAAGAAERYRSQIGRPARVVLA